MSEKLNPLKQITNIKTGEDKPLDLRIKELKNTTLIETFDERDELKKQLSDSEERNKELQDRVKMLEVEAVEFVEWIGRKTVNDPWFKYGWRGWYVHLEGHLSSEQLYNQFIAYRNESGKEGKG
jgi:predicted nuclease with TOPRIM domain